MRVELSKSEEKLKVCSNFVARATDDRRLWEKSIFRFLRLRVHLKRTLIGWSVELRESKRERGKVGKVLRVFLMRE